MQDEALARERCGRMFYEGGARELSATYLGAARELYARWGATAKVHALEEEFPALVAEAAGRWSTTSSDGERAVDMFALFSALESLSGELDLGRLLQRLLQVGLELAGAQRGALVLDEEGKLFVRVVGAISEPIVPEHTPLEFSDQVSCTIVEHVRKTGEILVLAHAAKHGPFVRDTYVSARGVKSVMVLPITRPARCVGVLYFENNLATHAFTPARLQGLRLLSSEIAISSRTASCSTVSRWRLTSARAPSKPCASLRNRAEPWPNPWTTTLSSQKWRASPFPLPNGARWSSPTRTETFARWRSLMPTRPRNRCSVSSFDATRPAGTRRRPPAGCCARARRCSCPTWTTQHCASTPSMTTTIG